MVVYNSRTKKSRDDFETPSYFFKLLDDIFHFTLDPCASHTNHLCKKYYTKEDDGLNKDWTNEICFINPPYKQKEPWINKVILEKIDAVFLIPSATDTALFEKIWENCAEIWFVIGRIQFLINGEEPLNKNGKKTGNNRPSMLCIFDGYKHKKPEIKLFYHKRG